MLINGSECIWKLPTYVYKNTMVIWNKYTVKYVYIYTLNLFNSKYHMHCNLVVKLSTMLELHVIKHFQGYLMSSNVVQRCAQFTLPRLHCTSFITYTYPFQLFASPTSTPSSSSNPSLCSSLSFIFRLPSTLSFICAFSRRFSSCCFCCCQLFVFLCVALRSRFYTAPPFPLLPHSSSPCGCGNNKIFLLVCQSPPRRWPWTCSTQFCTAGRAPPCPVLVPCLALPCFTCWPVRAAPLPPLLCASQCAVGAHVATAAVATLA